MGPPSRYYTEPPYPIIGNWNFTDDTGAQAAYPIFTVTGDVEIQVIGVCKASITSAGAPTIALGVAGTPNALITTVVDGTDLIINEIWQDATPTVTVELVAFATSHNFVISNSQDVIFTIGAADITAGEIVFYARWIPLSRDGKVVAA